MILEKFESLKELHAKLSALPPEKRRVVVLVNRHPEEGSMAISLKHHVDWEKHGAVVVPIPMEWTPSWIADAVQKGKLDARSLRSHLKKVEEDDTIVDSICRKFRVPVVNFHGTGLDHREWPSLKAYVSFRGNRAGLIQPHPKIGLVNPDKNPADRPNEVLAEFYFTGRDSGKWAADLPYWFVHGPTGKYLSHPSRARKVELDYRTHPLITSRAIRDFTENCENDFEQVIAHLASTGLKP